MTALDNFISHAFLPQPNPFASPALGKGLVQYGGWAAANPLCADSALLNG